MLSSDEAVEKFMNEVSIEQWHRQAVGERNDQGIDDIMPYIVGGLTGGLIMLFVSVCSFFVLSNWSTIPALTAIVGIAIGFGTMLVSLEESRKPRLLKKRYRRAIEARGELELSAAISTDFVDTNAVATHVIYHGKRHEIDSIVVDPHADDALAIAARIRTRDDIANQQLQAIDINVNELTQSPDYLQQRITAIRQGMVEEAALSAAREEERQLFQQILSADQPPHQQLPHA